MKRTINIFALAVAALALVIAQAQNGAAGLTDDEKTLMRIEHELTDAMLKNDASVVERHYADTFTFTNPDGGVQDKAAVISNLKSGALKFESSKIDEMRVQVYGDAAVVTVRTTDRGKVNGVDVSGQYRWTDFYVRRGGRWQLVAAQGTRVAER